MANQIKQYDYTVNALKGIFAVSIMCNHLAIVLINLGDVNTINYLLVDAFFVFSGYFFASGLCRAENFSVVKIVKRRIRSIYPQYIFGILIVVGVLIYHPAMWQERCVSIWNFIEEPLLVHQAFKVIEPLNGADWYVSAWIIATAFYAVIFKFFKKYGLLTVSAVIFLIYFAWVRCNGYMSGYVRLVVLGGGYRGLAIMGFGIWVYYVTDYIIERYGHKINAKISSIVEAACLPLYVWTLTYSGQHPSVSFIAMGLIAMVLFLGKTNGINAFMQKVRPLQWLGDWSMYLYLAHIPAMLVWIYVFSGFGGKFLLMVTVVSLTAMSKYIPERLGKLFRKMREKQKDQKAAPAQSRRFDSDK